MKFLFVCGGTAGHINPAIGIAMEVRCRMADAKILFVGAGRDLEKRLIPQAGFHVVNIRMSGLKRGLSPAHAAHNFKTLVNLTTASFESANLLRRFKPDAVIGTGGYICYPVMKKAVQMGIATFLHEPNAVPGLTTKLLSAYVDKVLITFPGLDMLYRRPERLVISGTPVRSGFYLPPEKTTIPGSGERPLVLSFWGSLGAERMNDTIAEFIKLNVEGAQFEHIHATGKKGGVREMKSRLKRLGAPDALPQCIDIREYIDDMPSVMAAADIVLSRAGASTVAELTVLGKPAVLVPSPFVPNNHQEENAKQMKKAGGAMMILEKDCTGNALYDAVTELLGDSDRLKRMSYAQRSLAAPNAAEKIVDLVVEHCAQGKKDEEQMTNEDEGFE